MARLIYDEQRLQGVGSPQDYEKLERDCMAKVLAGTRAEYKALCRACEESDEVRKRLTAAFALMLRHADTQKRFLAAAGGSYRQWLLSYLSCFGWNYTVHTKLVGAKGDIEVKLEVNGRIVATEVAKNREMASEAGCKRVMPELIEVERKVSPARLLASFGGIESPPQEYLKYLKSKPLH